MGTKQSSICSGKNPAQVPAGAETITQYAEVAVATTDIDASDMIELGVLPANCVPCGYVLDSTDLDTNGTPTITFDFGIIDTAGTAISTAAADGGDEWIDGSTLPQAGGIAEDTASAALWRVLRDVTPVDYDRKVGIKVATGAATAAAGTVAMELKYRAA